MALAMDTLQTGREQLATALRIIEQLRNTGERLGFATAKAQAFTHQLLDRAGEVKREKPLYFLAAIAGLALVAGMATRIWRANTNA
jgi:hypothetical protein